MRFGWWRELAVFSALVCAAIPLSTCAATFPGNARVEIQDPSGGLSWNPGAAAQTVSCWVKLAVPSGVTLTENMTIMVDRTSGSESDPFGYLFRYNIYSGNIEFLARGTSGVYSNTLVERPYLERWYHLAVARSGDNFDGYLDGRKIFSGSGTVGNSSNNNGAAIGGWGNTQYLYGEVQEVAIYQSYRDQVAISQYMYEDQPAVPELKGYFKLGYSTNNSDFYKNFAPSPPTNTDVGVKQGSGSIIFEEVNEAGEQSAFDSRRNGGAAAITPLGGAFWWEQSLLSRPTPGIGFDFRVGYSSGNSFNNQKLDYTGFDPFSAGPMGRGWRHTFETRIVPGNYFDPVSGINVLGLMLWNGSLETWDYNETTDDYRPRHNEYRGELAIPNNSYCTWTTPDRLVYKFKHPFFGSNANMRGRLVEIRDPNSNTVQVVWNTVTATITQVVDSAGGMYSFSYNAQYELTNVAFQGWSLGFTFNASNRLATVQKYGPASYTNVNTRWSFNYGANGLLQNIVDPRSLTNLTVLYDKYGRKSAEVDAIGRTNVTEYGVPDKRTVRRTDPAGNQWFETYDRKQHLLSQTDPLNNKTSFAYDEHGNRTCAVEPLGWTTRFAYDDRANVVAITNALGLVSRRQYHGYFNKVTNDVNAAGWATRYTYDSHGNLLQQADDLGRMVSCTYTTNGLVTTAIDASSNVTQFTYTPDGFVASKTDPATNAWTYSRNELGWVMSETNPVGKATFYTYDLNGRVVQALDPIGRRFIKTFDGNGNVIAESDGKSDPEKRFTIYNYDAANQRTQMVDRLSNAWAYTYTKLGAPQAVQDPLGNTANNVYDAANRLIRSIDPLGASVITIYNANGKVVSRTDKLGRVWTTTYDRLNRGIAEQDPLGNTRGTTFDIVGRVKTVTTPSGFTTTHDYDGRGRLIRWVDGEGYEWRYAYDANANITNITDALNGHYVMAYGPRNERLMERNQDGFEWRYVYDSLARLAQQTDPNAITRAITYDDASRIDYVEFSTGRYDDYSFDDNNNLLGILRSGSGSPVGFALDYDAMDRVVKYTDNYNNNKTVQYRYDAIGRATNVVYPDGKVLTQSFDALNRLTNQVAWGTWQTRYAYDKENRLVSRTYPNGITQTNAFDSAGRITDLKYLVADTNTLIALAYAYDRNGNKTQSDERGTLLWTVPAGFDETATNTASGRLVARYDACNPARNFTYQYDGRGNMTNAVSPVQSYGFRYDEENRVTGVTWTSNSTVKTIANKYDGLGRRVSRTLNGVETRYTLTVIGDMERILCDYNGSTPVAWYVHGPDLCYKVDNTNGLTCFHADAMANVIATTDAATNFISEYAYSPYGRILGMSGTTNNPYKFVGSQGVMEELPEFYFMRARYYSAEAGVFLSTDPLKKIGPGWKSVMYSYGGNNPIAFLDASGLAPQDASYCYFAKRELFHSETLWKDAGFLQAVLNPLLGFGMNAKNIELYHVQALCENASGELVFNVGFTGSPNCEGSDCDEWQRKGLTHLDVDPGNPWIPISGKYDAREFLQAASEVDPGSYSLAGTPEFLPSAGFPLNVVFPGKNNCQDWQSKVQAAMKNEKSKTSSTPAANTMAQICNQFQLAQLCPITIPATSQGTTTSSSNGSGQSAGGGGGGRSWSSPGVTVYYDWMGQGYCGKPKVNFGGGRTGARGAGR